MDHLLFLIFDVYFLVKICLCINIHFSDFCSANKTAKNIKILNFVKQV